MAQVSRRIKWLNYFKPTIYVRSILDINLLSLYSSGIKAIFCDLDNTLSPHFTHYPSKKVIDFCKEVSRLNMTLVIISNNNKKRVTEYVKKLKSVQYMIWNAMKPLKIKVKKIMNKLNLEPDDVIFIGDQFITDVWVANRIGSKSILVLPLLGYDNDSSSFITRFLDKMIYKRLQSNLNIGFYLKKEGTLDEQEQYL